MLEKKQKEFKRDFENCLFVSFDSNLKKAFLDPVPDSDTQKKVLKMVKYFLKSI